MIPRHGTDHTQEAASERRLRVFIGPYNIAGSGRILADELRAQGVDAEFVVLQDQTWHENADYNFRVDRLSRLARYAVTGCLFLIALIKYDQFHFMGKSLLPLGLDLPFLRLFGKKVLIQYNGSDIRLRSLEEQRNPYMRHVVAPNNDRSRDRGKRMLMRWHRIFAHRVFAVRNLNAHVRQYFPEDRVLAEPWVTNPIRLSDYPVGSPTRHQPPVIVHAPSNPAIKGTRFIDAAMETLRQRGYRVDYRRIQGLAHPDLQRLLREEADIVVDQVLAGGFGSLSVEAMAAGKPVVVYLIPKVKERFYPDCPAVDATVDTLADRLAWLLDHPEEWERLGREGRRFVESRFDVTRIVAELKTLYEALATPHRR